MPRFWIDEEKLRVHFRNIRIITGDLGVPLDPEDVVNCGGLLSSPREPVLRIASCRVVGNIDIYWDNETGIVVDGRTDTGEPTYLIAEVPGGVDEDPSWQPRP